MTSRILATPITAEIPILLHIKYNIIMVSTGAITRKAMTRKVLSKRATSFERRFTA
jgi:hypothetical protein